MSRLPFFLSEKATNDLDEIWHYTHKKWSIEQANKYYNLILDKIDYICNNIDTGKSMSHIRKNYRAEKVKSHIIFYQVVNETVEIIRILHERMDIESRLYE